MQPGDYRIPADVSPTLAKCARADGYGEIVEEANFRKRGRPSKKQAAPENKLADSAAENKADLGGADGDRGGERAELEPGASRGRAAQRLLDAGGQ